MLVLSRRVGEVIIIGKNIRIKVLGSYGSQTRIGIEAPPDVTIDREEIHRRREAGKTRTPTPTEILT
jgi:carbon storage regulator